MTHHAPCTSGTSNAHVDGKKGDMWSGFQTDLLDGEIPKLREGDAWVFGNTHFCCDFQRNGVRVYSNQYGGNVAVEHREARAAAGTPLAIEFDVEKVFEI
ncbi:hypothetical protein GLAREA_04746 [Glarea lozoyensis ATCC 20868]|uniref:Uncharacterized protein n=1 Tax=Glarea lozoyensis (strain ATCC 20868 / MF5171) TaxID=1116229 RepID=S3CQI7_GLAL2|nr:uncharacterized protein GLAREA_04746 [Glarea lozoyensis ATCC 20868]EPE27955.1 hypothetical protein GLAREA_04746 [Glarea lozoyensis ATCC 20868]